MRRYPLFLACAVLCAFQASAQWKWLNPLPEGNEFFDAFFVSRDTGWVVGGNGAVIRTTNGGTTWIAQDNPLRPTPFICLSVVFVDNRTGLISANTGALLRTDDAGTTWRRLPAGGVGIQKLKRAPDGAIWGFGSLGVIARTTDAGLTWERFPTGITSVVFDVDFPSPGKVVAACGNGIVLTSTDNGSSWTSKTLPVTTDIVSLSFADPLNAFAVQRAMYLLRSTDGGETWTDTTFFVNALRDVRFVDGQTGWLLSNSPGAVMKTDDGGRSWRQIVVDETFRYTFERVITRGAQEAFLVGDGGAMFQTTNGGANWVQLGTAMTRSHVNAVTGISNTHAWVFGERCVHGTTDGGVTWSENRADTLSIHTGIALSPTRIIAGGTQGEVHVSANGGRNWMTQVLPPRGRIERFHFVDATTGWLAGNHGTIAKTTNGGSVWFYTDPGVTHDFHAVHARSAEEAWIAGSGGKVYHTTDGGATWDDRSPNTTATLLAVHFISATTGWVGGQMVLYQTTDGGRSWEQRSLPGLDVVYDIVFLDAYKGFVVLSRGVAWTNDGGWTFYRVDYPSTGLHDIDVESDGTLWLAGDFGVVQSYTPTPVIALTPPSLDFGDVSINRTKDLSLTIDNTGERTLHISNVAVLGTGFTLLSLQSDTIPPGGRTGAYVRFAPADTGVAFGLLTVLSDAGLGDPAVELRGRGVPPGESALVHWPDTLDIGVIVLGNIAAGEVHIRNRGQRNLRINDERIVGKDSVMFQVGRPSSFILTPGYEDSVQVIFAPLRPEPFEAFLSLETDDPAQPQYLVPIRGEAVGPKIVVVPDTLFFGWVIVDSTRTLYLTIRNDGKADLLTANHRLEGPDAGDFDFVPPPPVPIPPSGSVMIPVSFRPRSLGMKTAYLYIESTDFMNPSVAVTLIGRPTTTGVEDFPVAPLYRLELYPNPVSLSDRGHVSVRCEAAASAPARLTIYDALGRAVREVLDEGPQSGAWVSGIPLAGLKAGVYHVRFETSSLTGFTSAVQRLVVLP